jgi:hypothetical protein
MSASNSHDERQSDGAIRAVVIRLSRPDGERGAVIERAAIMAEGSSAGAIEAWVIAHGGAPEAPVASASTRGMYGSRPDRSHGAGAGTPRRYVLPADALV